MQVTRIRSDETEGPISIDNIAISDIDNTGNVINSGTVLGLPGLKEKVPWIYIPINQPFDVKEEIWSKVEKLFEGFFETSNDVKALVADYNNTAALQIVAVWNGSNPKPTDEAIVKSLGAMLSTTPDSDDNAVGFRLCRTAD